MNEIKEICYVCGREIQPYKYDGRGAICVDCLFEMNYQPPVEPIKSNKVQRNSLCPCGSGKKYKKCCLK